MLLMQVLLFFYLLNFFYQYKYHVVLLCVLGVYTIYICWYEIVFFLGIYYNNSISLLFILSICFFIEIYIIYIYRYQSATANNFTSSIYLSMKHINYNKMTNGHNFNFNFIVHIHLFIYIYLEYQKRKKSNRNHFKKN